MFINVCTLISSIYIFTRFAVVQSKTNPNNNEPIRKHSIAES